MNRKFLTASTETLAEQRQVRVICSTDAVDRAGEVIVQAGIQLGDYQANPVVLWQHDPMQPIARAIEIGVVAGKLQATVQFPDEGVSAKADEVYGLIKAGVVNSTSVGFEPIDAEPMNAAQPRGPQRYLKCGLMEFSFVSVPANPGAAITARSNKSADPAWKVGASRNLPLDTESEWDGSAAEKSIFDKAEFDDDDPDTTFARKGFLAYDSAGADLKGAYKLPFAKVIDGRLTAVAAGIRAAASRLDQADLPDDVATKARAVIDHYEARMKDKGAAGIVTKDVKLFKAKDLYGVASLAYALANLGYIEDSATWEAEMEGDGSQVPAMLGAAMQQLGAALVAMTQEEVAELLGTETAEGSAAVAKGLVTKDAGSMAKAYAAARSKAGRKLSAASAACIKDALDTCGEAIGLHGQGVDKLKAAQKALGDLLDSADGTDASPGDDDAGAKAAPLNQRQRQFEFLRRQAV